MRRTVVTALVMSAICAGVGSWLDLSNEGMQELIAPFVVVTVLIVLWPEMGNDVRTRLRQHRRG